MKIYSIEILLNFSKQKSLVNSIFNIFRKKLTSLLMLTSCDQPVDANTANPCKADCHTEQEINKSLVESVAVLF